MHVDDAPYEILRRPRPCLVETPDGVQEGLVVGRWGPRELVVHGTGGFDTVTWAPTPDVRVLPANEWAPWMAALSANA